MKERRQKKPYRKKNQWFYNLLGEMKKQCISIPFLVGICSVVLFMMLDTYEVTENGMQERYTLLEMMLVKGRQWICENTSFNWQEIILQQPTRQLMDYVTVIASLPFLIQFCNERRCGNIRMHIFRAGRTNYYFSKITSAMLTGGMMLAIGFLLGAWMIYLYLPSAVDIGIEIDFFLPEGFTSENFGTLFLFCVAGVFLYGMVATIFSIALSAFTKDIYICLTIPFLIKWVNSIFHSYLYSYLYIDHEVIKGWKMELLDWWNRYGQLEQIIYEVREQRFQNAGLVFLGLTLVGSIVFVLRMNGRNDYGE